jgi:hypothetical protein
MPEKSGFFDSTVEDPREYTADEFAEYFRRVLTDGIFNGGTNLQVTADGTNMNVNIADGYAWIQGYMYKVYDGHTLTLDTADPTLNRIDRIVLRLDKSLEKRSIEAVVLKGTPSATPTPPALTRNENIYEISLAQVEVIAGKSFIEGFQVTDERLDNNVCGLVNSLIQADTTEIFNQFQAWYNSKTTEFQQEWDDWFATATATFNADWSNWFTQTQNEWDTYFQSVQNEGYETPSGAQAKVDAAIATHSADTATNAHLAKNIGIDDVDGNFTSTDVEGALKEAIEKANAAFTSASNGKSTSGALAMAITGKGGTLVDGDSDGVYTFQELTDGVNSISVGKYDVGDYLKVSQLGQDTVQELGSLSWTSQLGYNAERYVSSRYSVSADGRYLTASDGNDYFEVYDLELKTATILSKTGKSPVKDWETGMYEAFIIDNGSSFDLIRINPLTGEEIWTVTINEDLLNEPYILSHQNEIWFKTLNGSTYWVHCYDWDTGAFVKKFEDPNGTVYFGVGETYYLQPTGEYTLGVYYKSNGTKYTDVTIMNAGDHSPNNSRYVHIFSNVIIKGTINGGTTVTDSMDAIWRIQRSGYPVFVKKYYYDYYGADYPLQGESCSRQLYGDFYVLTTRNNNGSTAGDYVTEHRFIPMNFSQRNNMITFSGSLVINNSRNDDAGDVYHNGVLIWDYNERVHWYAHNTRIPGEILFCGHSYYTGTPSRTYLYPSAFINYNPRVFMSMLTGEKALLATKKYLVAHSAVNTYDKTFRIASSEPVKQILS